MSSEIRRIAIVNRGEPAMRFIHAVREFNQEHGTALCTIALFTDPDRHAMFVREADEAVSLGAAHVIDPATNQPRSSYVDYAILQRALTAARADAVWVGWGFVAEHADFADLCRDLGIVFIGPDGDVMRRLGDKITSKLIAEQAQIPVAPWSGGAVETIEDARRHAHNMGYPLLIKATAGGGGHGIQRVDGPDQLAKAFEAARSAAFKSFGNPTVFMEQLVTGARHVEVQIIADHYGNTWAAGVRDCTIQRRHQKVLEEAPSPALTEEEDRQVRDAAVRLSKAVGYHNAGTVEFLFQPQTRTFAFMEMNTRLQVEHPVTECTTGIDLVKLQIHVARGGQLTGDPPRASGHAIEVRLNAEDPEEGFAPAPGSVERFGISAGPGVRVDSGVGVGDVIPAEFDSMVAKIIGYGRTRDEALARLQRVLRESVVVIKGGASNRTFLLELLNRPEVRCGEYDIGWLDRLAKSGEYLARPHADIALVHAAIESYLIETALEQSQFLASAVRGRPQVRTEVARTIELRYRGNAYSLKVHRLGPREFRVFIDKSRIDARLEPLGQFEYWLTCFERHHIISVTEGLTFHIEVDGVSHRINRDDGGVVRSPAPAVVVSIGVNEGDEVREGDQIAVLEAMKMEMPVRAPFSGKVRQILTMPYVQVRSGAPLMQIDPETEDDAADLKRVSFSRAEPVDAESDARPRCLRSLDELKQLMLGFDVDPAQAAGLVDEWKKSREQLADGTAARQCEEEILNIFVDSCALFQPHARRRPSVAGEEPSPEACLFAYLRMLETRGEGLPASFLDALRLALSHYGVLSLDRSPELEESLLYIYKAHQRLDQLVAPILAILQRRLERLDLSTPVNEAFRVLLSRMIALTRTRYPAVSDLAREVRYRYFDQPLFEQARKQVYAQAEAHLEYLAANPDSSDRRERIHELIECPQPLVGLFARRFPSAAPALRELMLDVLTTRYYKIRKLSPCRSVAAGAECCVTAEYDHEGKHIQVFAAHTEYSQITAALRTMLPVLASVPADHDIVVDFLASHSGALGEPDATQAEVRSMILEAGLARPIRRIVVAVAGDSGAMQYFTFRPAADTYEEDRLYRGVQPMLGKRLHLWRLENFNIQRLPSVDDVYLLHAVAKENPKDERLFGCAEIRDLTPVRDESGRIVQLPHLERMLTEVLAGFRRFQAQRPSNQRLHWNRVLLYVWPPMHLKPDELNDIVHRLAPEAAGLGLEQVAIRCRIASPETGELRDMVVRLSSPGGSRVMMTFRPATNLQPLKPLSDYTQKVVRMRQRGLIYPYEIIKMLTPTRVDTATEYPPGDFVEYDFNGEDRLVPVDRPYGQNKANIIVGVIRNFTAKYPEGMARVALFGDPSKELGALAEPECRRIIGALELAAREHLPLEWFALSAGAKISMDSGVENMDWIALVLRRIVEFTQAAGEINVIVDGINVGAQPYWNAEATMLMHTRGILVMTPNAAMVLTGKRALEYSGSVSAEDNQGIGGYDRIMGVNGQAQYWAQNIDEACQILLRHYEHTYVIPGERFPRRAVTADTVNRDVQTSAHGDDFATLGDIFSDVTNPGRKKSFDIRKVMKGTVDQDHPPLERWAGMRDAETSVIWDAHLGGYPVCLIGIESRPVPRLGFVPADGPDQWTAGTLFPLSSKKVARAINAASDNRPVVVLANLSGFDGSPESLRKLQLEYGAEIGRSVVNFKGPIVFCVISRYHGGAYVVFSRTLNESIEVAALEGTYASVIGGAPAAAVVFAGEVEARTKKDSRLQELSAAMAKAEGVEKSRLRRRYDEMFRVVHSEKLGEMADEFDRVHCVERALKVGALNRIIAPDQLRAYLVNAIERGMQKRAEEVGILAQAAGH
jgi:acetyl/propionyl-CoA carboxylase alpha subunit/acetyl-CoA carboxylase carboxyltransferase component